MSDTERHFEGPPILSEEMSSEDSNGGPWNCKMSKDEYNKRRAHMKSLNLLLVETIKSIIKINGDFKLDKKSQAALPRCPRVTNTEYIKFLSDITQAKFQGLHCFPVFKWHKRDLTECIADKLGDIKDKALVCAESLTSCYLTKCHFSVPKKAQLSKGYDLDVVIDGQPFIIEAKGSYLDDNFFHFSVKELQQSEKSAANHYLIHISNLGKEVMQATVIHDIYKKIEEEQLLIFLNLRDSKDLKDVPDFSKSSSKGIFKVELPANRTDEETKRSLAQKLAVAIPDIDSYQVQFGQPR